MKLFILLFLISFNSFAGYVAESKINQCDRTVYTDAGTCQSIESETCFKTPEVEKSYCGIYAIQDVLIDDLEKPIRNKTNVTACEGEEACRVALESLECEEKYIDSEYTEVYCSKITGYEQKFSHKIAVVDEVKLAQKEAKADAIRQVEEAKKFLTETDYMLLRELDGGEPMPIDIKTQRAAKRVLINSLETQFDL